MIFMEVNEDKSLSRIIEVYNCNMGEAIPELEANKKYQYITSLYHAYGFDFIDAIIEICILYRMNKPYALFKSIAQDYIASGITTKEQLEASRLKRKNRFNCAGKSYDFDVLEKKLLGWE